MKIIKKMGEPLNLTSSSGKNMIFSFRGRTRDDDFLFLLPINKRSAKKYTKASHGSPCLWTCSPIIITKGLQLNVFVSRKKNTMCRVGFYVRENMLSSLMMMNGWLLNKLTKEMYNKGDVRTCVG